MKKIIVLKKRGAEAVKVYKLHNSEGFTPCYYNAGDTHYGQPNPAISVERMERIINSGKMRLIFAE